VTPAKTLAGSSPDQAWNCCRTSPLPVDLAARLADVDVENSVLRPGVAALQTVGVAVTYIEFMIGHGRRTYIEFIHGTSYDCPDAAGAAGPDA